MEQAATLAVPLTVDVGVGENWKDSEGMTPTSEFGMRDGESGRSSTCGCSENWIDRPQKYSSVEVARR